MLVKDREGKREVAMYLVSPPPRLGGGGGGARWYQFTKFGHWDEGLNNKHNSFRLFKLFNDNTSSWEKTLSYVPRMTI